MSKKRLVIYGLLLVVLGAGVWFYVAQSHRAPIANTHPSQPSRPDLLSCVARLPDELKLGQKLMVATYSDQLSSQAPTLKVKNIGGVIIMNQTPADVVAAYKDSQAIPPFVATDQEGGTVQRYRSEGALPGADEMVATHTPEDAYRTYLQDDIYLKTMGITTNFAPVVDVISRSPSPLPGRMFSSDPTTVTSYATQAIRASQAASITPVIKHFPGLGSADGNTDFGTATTDPLAALQERDLAPYRDLASFNPDVMVANAIVPDLTNGQPASLSRPAVQLLRGLGYAHSVIYSDSLTASAIPGTLDSAVLSAWQAGIDVALIAQTHTDTPITDDYLASIIMTATHALKAGTLDRNELNTSVLRILTRKAVDPCALSV